MKRTWLVGLALCGLASFATVAPAFACIGPDGKPVEGTDGLVTNCGGGVVEEPVTAKDAMELSTDTIDYGYFSEVGRTYTQTFTITNKSSETIAVKVSANKPEIEGMKDDSKLAADWIAFVGGIRYFEIAANSSKTIGMRVVVPADAKYGSQYATIKVENTTGEKTEEIAVRMTVATEGVAFGGEVAKNYVQPVGLDDRIHAGITVKNSGNAGFAAVYSVRVTPRFGLEEWKDVVVEETEEVYPDSETEFTVPEDAPVAGFGMYTVEQKIVYVNSNGEQIEEVSTRTMLNLPIWAVAVAGGVIFAIIVLIIVLSIVKKAKANKEEEKPKNAIKEKKFKKDKKDKKAKEEEKPGKESIEIEM